MAALAGYGRPLLALAAGVAAVGGFAPFGLFPLPVLALALWFVLLQGRRPGQAFRLGYLFGLGLFGGGVHWVYISIHTYGHSPLPLALLAMAALVAYLALFPAGVAWAAVRWPARDALQQYLLRLPALWLLSEWLRGWLFTGFPWLSLGYSQIDGPLAGFAPLVGSYGLGGLVAASASALALLWLERSRQAGLALAVIAALWLAGGLLRGLGWTEPQGLALRVSLVQGNIPQELKWQPEQQAATLEHYLELSRKEWDGSDWHADLVVWPETAVPAFYHQMEGDFLARLRAEVLANDTDLLTGIPVLDRTHWRYYNAVINLRPPTRFYYKRHLVPFGEYLPLRGLLGDLLAVMPLPVADFSPGDDGQPLLRAAGHPVGVSICFEVIFGEEMIQALPEAAFLVNVSNDAWFGDSLAPHQHLEMARMRALETGRWLLRATNTGISALIAPDGRVVERSPQFQTAVVRGEIEPRGGATPYVLAGNAPVLILAAIAIAVSSRRIFPGRDWN